MKITAVHAYITEEVFEKPFLWRNGLSGSNHKREHIWLHLETDAGVDGLARFWKSGYVALDVIRRLLQEQLVGKNPLQKECIWKEMWEADRSEAFPLYVMSLVDVALWDITGKVANLPVYALLGGYRESIPAYASTVTFATLEEYLDVADQCLEHGMKAIKLHAWGDAKKDAYLCLRLREHVGEDIALMYDASAAFTVQDALYLGRALSEADYLWYEEPVRETSIHAYRRLRRELDLPLLAGETSAGYHHNIADFIISDAADMVRTSVQYKGGFTGALRVAHLADSFQMTAQVHGHGIENLHLCMAIPNNDYYETMIRTNPIQVDPRIDNAGLIHAPQKAGVGYEMTLEQLAEQAVASL